MAAPGLDYIYATRIADGRVKMGMPRDQQSLYFRLKYKGATYEKWFSPQAIREITSSQKIELTVAELYKMWLYAFVGAKGFKWTVTPNNDKEIYIDCDWDFLIVTTRKIRISLPYKP
jgi:hypothetical protein